MHILWTHTHTHTLSAGQNQGSKSNALTRCVSAFYFLVPSSRNHKPECVYTCVCVSCRALKEPPAAWCFHSLPPWIFYSAHHPQKVPSEWKLKWQNYSSSIGDSRRGKGRWRRRKRRRTWRCVGDDGKHLLFPLTAHTSWQHWKEKQRPAKVSVVRRKYMYKDRLHLDPEEHFLWKTSTLLVNLLSSELLLTLT